ncbi:MAG TPA: LPS export ABC transporter permease LptG [Xanthomonadales bacterium]|nr:LPS export ABC transporter permease LptG [Xanthomonadales bacterium]
MIKLVDRYLGRASILGTLVVWSSLTVLFVLLALMNELRSVQNDYSTGDVFWYVALTAPRLAYQVFPVSALLGALVGVGGLAATNELVAFRTSGVSRLRLSVAALAGAMALAVPVMIMGEWVAPAAEHQARAFRLHEMVGQVIMGGPRGVWMRDGTDIVNIQLPLLSASRGQQSVAFNNVVIYSFTEQVDLKAITRAASATHADDGWTLNGVSEVRFEPAGAKLTRVGQRPWATEVKPALLDSAVTRPQRLSLRSLLGYLDYLQENGLDDTVYRAAFWEKIIYPFTVVALVLAGMPFVFGSSRNPNLGMRLFFGMMLGGLFLIVSRMVESFGDAYQLPAMMNYLLPPLLLGAGAVTILRRTV